MSFDFSKKSEDIVVAYHGVDTIFKPRENYSAAILDEVRKKFNLPDNFLLYVGRLNLRKNVEHLLRAIPLLKNKTIQLVIVGANDWKKSNHNHIIEELNITGRIHFTGAVYRELGIIYSMATIFCFPSYAESFGLPPLEAMASGVPIVVSNATSLPEICGDAGHYIHPNRPEEIAAGIDKLLNDSDYYAQQKQRGLIQAKKFTWDHAAKTVIDSMISNVKMP
ncbi:MAG: glycosyltransferase family 4 protein [Bacteroidetes bacterium]|nr:glycosyltransferase family 4 protein [Bacteroidota bacterium]